MSSLFYSLQIINKVICFRVLWKGPQIYRIFFSKIYLEVCGESECYLLFQAWVVVMVSKHFTYAHISICWNLRPCVAVTVGIRFSLELIFKRFHVKDRLRIALVGRALFDPSITIKNIVILSKCCSRSVLFISKQFAIPKATIFKCDFNTRWDCLSSSKGLAENSQNRTKFFFLTTRLGEVWIDNCSSSLTKL